MQIALMWQISPGVRRSDAGSVHDRIGGCLDKEVPPQSRPSILSPSLDLAQELVVAVQIRSNDYVDSRAGDVVRTD